MVSGLWFGRFPLIVLAHRLRSCGFQVLLFPYHSRSETPDQAALRLGVYCARLGAIHLVGYSLGGLVVRAFCRHDPDAYVHAVVLGAPFRGSRVARCVERIGLGRIFGAARYSLRRGVYTIAPARLAVVTGTHGHGLASLCAYGETHDGVVRAAETRLRGHYDAVALPVSHWGLVLALASAGVLVDFLAQGQFGSR